MTWRELQLTLLLMAEEKVGAAMRDRERMARAVEDAAWAKAGATAAEIGA